MILFILLQLISCFEFICVCAIQRMEEENQPILDYGKSSQAGMADIGGELHWNTLYALPDPLKFCAFMYRTSLFFGK